ncbi:hypothetical protein [Breznakiella homolactica]|uniref:Uncharacterized protein n=1 Tax=Breznakiella homolactica TaxID=2798577 RepID=A0A7T8BA46_9SPIR|nr:hypothetical protein [Breznakiella homolactica]QQO10279.1 hypothetical protein JFL75_04990 [Breznakiella homolactica]
MKTRKTVLGIIIAAAFAVGFMACSQVMSPEEGSVTVQLPGSAGGRAYTEAEKSTFTYTVTLTGPGGRTSKAEAAAGRTVTIGGLAAGLWTVEVRALNIDMIPLAYGSDTVTVTAGNSRALVKMGDIIYSLSQLKGAISDAKSGDTLYIGNDIEIDVPLEILKNLTFSSLGDYTLSRGSAHSNELFQIGSNTVTFKAEGANTLTLDGTNPNPGTQKPLITVNPAGVLILDKGSVLQNNENRGSINNGGAVFCKDGTVVVSGGIIRDNRDLTKGMGGGLYLVNSDFTMTAGEIYGNTASNGGSGSGGGICIENNTSAGAVRTVTVSGGSIYNNETSGGGGGLYYLGNSVGSSENKMILSGGLIYGNFASTGQGGGLCIVNADFTMSGGAVYRNEALLGGGVFAQNGDIFTMAGGHICSNEALAVSSAGGGLYIDNFTNAITTGARNAEIKQNISDNVEKSATGGDFSGIAIGGVNGENDICSMHY